MTAATQTLGHDSRILGLIGSGHMLSHFYNLSFPALLLIWRDEFGASFAALGLIITLFSLSTGLAQIPAGMLVDRYGARPVLVIGLLVIGSAMTFMSQASGMEMLFLLAAIAGIGNSVFHPADYAILNSSIDPVRMGKAFSFHTFSGHLGGAIAPATIVFLATLQDWRFALLVTGLAGIAVALLIFLQGGILQDDHEAKIRDSKEGQNDAMSWKASAKLLLTKQMALFFMFFLLASLTSSGVQSFSVVALVDLHSISLPNASTALTAFLFASTFGILLGGMAADYAGKHEWMAAGCFLTSSAIFTSLAVWSYPPAILIVVFIIAGLAQGMIRPARDMMVRAHAPKGTSGRVFAFTSTGIAMGSAAAPVFFGYIVDQGATNWIFWLLAIFNVLAIGTILGQQALSKPAGSPA